MAAAPVHLGAVIHKGCNYRIMLQALSDGVSDRSGEKYGNLMTSKDKFIFRQFIGNLQKKEIPAFLERLASIDPQSYPQFVWITDFISPV